MESQKNVNSTSPGCLTLGGADTLLEFMGLSGVAEGAGGGIDLLGSLATCGEETCGVGAAGTC